MVAPEVNEREVIYRSNALRVEVTCGIAVVYFDRQGEAINKFDAMTVTELAASVTAIARRSDVRGVLVTSAKDAFIVGADIFEFAALFAQPESAIRDHLARQNEVFTSFEDLPVPSIVAINGLALGGGFEMTLAADARVMSSNSLVGLPEVSLGLFPGYGGTVRLPRLAGAAVAIDWITGGKQHSAAKALAVGAVDEVTPAQTLEPAAIARLERMIASGDWRARRAKRKGAFEPDHDAAARARGALVPNSHNQPAALAAVELLSRCASLTRDQALVLEQAAFAHIARTQAAAAMIQLFVNDQRVRKIVRSYSRTAIKIQTAAVLGAGIMGGGIAFTSASRGVPVIMKDIVPRQLETGVAEADRLLARQVHSKRLTPDQARAVRKSIHPTVEFDGFEQADIVIEAVVEDLGVKKKVLAEVESQVATTTVIASNTSSLSIADMAQALRRPANFVGMHFFNPVPAMPLVEVIRGPQTADSAVATVVVYAATLGKTPVVVRECPGFLVNRVLTPYMIGFLRAVADGADYQQVDRVMEAFGWPMGPAHLQDVIGMDTLAHVLDVICSGYPHRMRLDFPNAVRYMVESGRLGQKSDAGWYRYASDEQGKRRKQSDPPVADLLEKVRRDASATEDLSVKCASMEDAAIADRLMLPMILESVRCLEERIVATPAEVDLSLVLGLGFPRHVGGPLKYVDWVGAGEIIRRCEALSSLGPLYEPSALLRELAVAKGFFHTSGAPT